MGSFVADAEHSAARLRFMNYFLNTGKKRWPNAPESAFAHLGNGTNAVICLPEQDIVIVARWIQGDALDELMKRVGEAVR